jgi:hypothetical protein
MFQKLLNRKRKNINFDLSLKGELNLLLDPVVINDYPTQALLLTVLATLVRNSSDENEIRILYQYIAEASIVFPKVFPVIHNLLDSKINHILQLSLDEAILDSVQSIILNMISTCELVDSNQQQLSYLQSCGFGGLWRFAQSFAISREKPENVELFVDCLEAMVETCLPSDFDQFSMDSNNNSMSVSFNNAVVNPNNLNVTNSIMNFNSNPHINFNLMASSSLGGANQLVNSDSNFSNSGRHNSLSNLNLLSNNLVHLSLSSNLITGSTSSISMGSLYSPTDKERHYDLGPGEAGCSGDGNKRNRRRNSSPKML